MIDPKLVLSWLLTAAGTPAIFIAALVPVREAGALLPQLFTASYLRQLPVRKSAWAFAALVQGLAVLGMAVAATVWDGTALGLAIVSLLIFFALARSVASVTYKDVLGKTVDKARRGRATGLASSLGAFVTLVFALALIFEVASRGTLVLSALFIAAAAWITGSVVFMGLHEEEGSTEGATPWRKALHHFRHLREDGQLRRFVIVRGLLTTTALAPPFMVAAASREGMGFDELGFLVVASAAASLVSSYVWGWLADRSSRQVLIVSALAGGTALGLTALSGFFGLLGHPLVLPVFLFVLMIAYQGVRLGRSTYLVDMATEETRAAYTAVSNTVIGLVLLMGAGFGVIASVTSANAVLLLMAGLAMSAVPLARGLDEVQD